MQLFCITWAVSIFKSCFECISNLIHADQRASVEQNGLVGDDDCYYSIGHSSVNVEKDCFWRVAAA